MAEDFLLCARWILPVEPAAALEDHAIAVRAGAIEALLPARDAASRYPELERIELPHDVVVPGLVNAHASSSGPASDDAALLACAEMLAGGITCFADASPGPEAALEAARACGMRVALGIVVSRGASAYASDFDDYLRKGLALRDRAREERMASFFLAPLAVQALSDTELRRVATLAAELDLPVQLRLGEAVADLERLGRLGLLGPNLALVHGAHLAPPQLGLLARHGSSVVHCASDAGVAPGLAPLAEMQRAGIDLAFGSGMASGSRRLDLFQEMRTAALLAAAEAGDAHALPPPAALRAATLGGAHALGLEGAIGSIAPGKQADLVALDTQAPWNVTSGDPMSWTVHEAGREDVHQVWVAGRLVFTRRMQQNASFPLLDTRGRLWQNLQARAGS